MKKRKILCLSIIITLVLAIIIFCIVYMNDDKLQYGYYYYIEEDGTSNSYVHINPDGTFEYSIDMEASSTQMNPIGNYIVKDNKIILLSSDDEFVFAINKKALVLVKGSKLTDEYIGNGAIYLFDAIKIWH